MTWTVAVPLKVAGARKTRLATVLGEAARAALAEAMLAHVLDTLAALSDISVLIVSAARPAGWTGRWHDDGGAELNHALAAARRGAPGPFAVIHADLPCLMATDVRVLLDAGSDGMALAPDRHGTGTNALALGDARPIEFVFGPGSLHAFARQGHVALVRRSGLALDVDGPDDLALARNNGLLA